MTPMLRTRFAGVAGAILVTGCTAATPPQLQLPASTVQAAAETRPVETAASVDAADDPAIWVPAGGNTTRFAGRDVAGVILGTDKKAGLYAYDLTGEVLQFLPDGLLNNVDLRPDGDGFIAAASDRGRMGVALYRYSPGGELVPAGFIASDVGEPYGMCLGRWNDTLVAVLVAKDGAVRLYRLDGDGTELRGSEQVRFRLASQSEGCVVDDATGDLFIGEENRGVWRFTLTDPGAPPVLVSAVGDGALVADVEGLAIVDDGGTRYLIGSSQGDDAFAVWQLGGDMPVYRGRFRVTGSDAADAVTGTDGVAALGGAVGPYPQGLVVVQDDVNTGGPQNFKLVDWRAIRAALEL